MSAVEDHPQTPLLLVERLRKWFPVTEGFFQRVTGHIKAVENVSFAVDAGQTLGLVGESGCGKTTVGRTVLGLLPPTGGRVLFRGNSLLDMSRRQFRDMHRKMQIVFQDPAGSLNPRMPIGEIVGEPLLVHRICRGSELRDRVADLLDRCGISPDAVQRYPHEFSGGQRQRIAIARALALQPDLIVCDEPTSALDVSIQSQILNLLHDLQDEFGIAYLFISHDMAVIHHICDRIAVMHEGRIVEIGNREQVINDPRHEYTKALLSAVPGAPNRKAHASD